MTDTKRGLTLLLCFAKLAASPISIVMPLPLPVTPPAWEMFLPQPDAVRPAVLLADLPGSTDKWTLPLALLRPLLPLLGMAEITDHENFLAGLPVESVLGPRILPSTSRRRVPLAWIGFVLGARERLFENIRGGCWVCGFPAVGRGRDLLRSGNMTDPSGLGAVLRELDPTGPLGTRLYFNFHYNQPEAACERVYLLDATAGRLHGFAFLSSALAPAKLK